MQRTQESDVWFNVKMGEFPNEKVVLFVTWTNLGLRFETPEGPVFLSESSQLDLSAWMAKGEPVWLTVEKHVHDAFAFSDCSCSRPAQTLLARRAANEA